MNKDLREVCFADIVEFADSVIDGIYDEEDHTEINIVGRYSEIRELLKYILDCDVNIECINISSPDYDEYSDEYLLCVVLDDGEIYVNCDRLKDTFGYSDVVGDSIYIFDDCSSKLVKHLFAKDKYLVSLEDSDVECEDCCGLCDCCADDNTKIAVSTDDDGDMHGFTVQQSDGDTYRSFTYYTTDELSRDDIDDMLRDAGF